MIKVKIDHLTTLGLIDTGSTASIIREDVYEKIGSPRLTKDFFMVSGFGGSKVRTRGSFYKIVSIDGDEFSFLFHVVPANSLIFEVVIGTEIS